MTAAYEIGASYLARGKSQQALEALTAFLKGEGFRAETDEAKRDLAAAVDDGARSRSARSSRGRRSSTRRSPPGEGYLAKFPNGPQSADAQRAILDTQLLIAARPPAPRAVRRGPRRLARRSSPQNPLDARVPAGPLPGRRELRRSRRSSTRRSPRGRPLAGKFPGTEPAAHAQFRIAAIFEIEKGDPAAAIERFRKVAVEPWQSQARQRVAVMEAKALTVVTPRAFRSGETAHLKITTRNLETLTFTAYKLDAEAYFRKKHALRRRRVARHRPGRPRRRVDGRRSPATPSTSRSRRPTTSRSSRCPASTS